MLLTTVPGPTLSRRLQPTILLTAKALLVLIAIAFAASLLPTPAQAQGSLSLGTVFVSDPSACQGSHWYYYTNPNTGVVTTMNCFGGTVSGGTVSGTCQNTQTLGFTYASLNPVGIALNVTKALGVIVFLTGSDGTTPTDGAT